MVSGTSFICEKIKEQGFLRKSHQKHTLWIRDPEKNSSRIRIPDPRVKKAPYPGSGSATLPVLHKILANKQSFIKEN
jgi:hypothetical protein